MSKPYSITAVTHHSTSRDETKSWETFVKCQIVRIVGITAHMVSVPALLCMLYSHRQSVNEQTWLCSSRTFFTKTADKI